MCMHQTQTIKIHEIKKLKVEVGESTIIVGDFNTPLSAKDRYTWKKLSKNIDDLSGTMNQTASNWLI